MKISLKPKPLDTDTIRHQAEVKVDYAFRQMRISQMARLDKKKARFASEKLNEDLQDAMEKITLSRQSFRNYTLYRYQEDGDILNWLLALSVGLVLLTGYVLLS